MLARGEVLGTGKFIYNDCSWSFLRILISKWSWEAVDSGRALFQGAIAVPTPSHLYSENRLFPQAAFFQSVLGATALSVQ